MRDLQSAQKDMRARWAPRQAKIRGVNSEKFRSEFLRMLRDCGFTPAESERWLLRAQLGPIIHDVLKDRNTLRLIRGEFLSLGINFPKAVELRSD